MSLLEKISNDLAIPKSYIMSINNFSRLYKIYHIKKKRGNGLRKIHHPAKELKTLHYWMINNIFSGFPVSKHSTAYGKGCSIRNNAMQHMKSNFILHADIEDFFGSIDRGHVGNLLKSNGYSQEDIDLICNIVLYKEHLTIGSVVSPMIANTVMYDFDNSLFLELTSVQDLAYTRYADDIVISSKKFILPEVLAVIDTKLEEYGFKRNIEKTYYSSKSRKRQITGVVLNNNINEVSIGSERLRQTKKDIYNFLIHKKGTREEIVGKLAFVKGVNEKQYRALVNKYKNYRNWDSLQIK